jgi:hypothetical protein
VTCQVFPDPQGEQVFPDPQGELFERTTRTGGKCGGTAGGSPTDLTDQALARSAGRPARRSVGSGCRADLAGDGLRLAAGKRAKTPSRRFEEIHFLGQAVTVSPSSRDFEAS